MWLIVKIILSLQYFSLFHTAKLFPTWAASLNGIEAHHINGGQMGLDDITQT